MTERRLGPVTPRRAVTVLIGVGIILIGHAVGGFGGAAVIGAGIGVAIVGLGKREPHLLRRRADDEPDEPDEPREPGRSEW